MYRNNRRTAGSGFTLLEMLIALTVTLILMALVMEMFSKVTTGINAARANMDLNDQLRHAKHRLIYDLRGTTAPTVPPLDPTMELGYFEYVEGPRVASSQIASGSVGGDIGDNLSSTASNHWSTARGSANGIAVNSVIGDTDDILMFTTSSYDDQFVGRAGVKSGVNLSLKSRHAEVAWFLRRRTPSEVRNLRVMPNNAADNRPEFFSLYRRVFVVSPYASVWGTLNNIDTDLSLRPDGGSVNKTLLPVNMTTGNQMIDPVMRRNHLGELTMRENRSLHQPFVYPYQMMYVSPSFNGGIDDHRLFDPRGLPGADATKPLRNFAFNVALQHLSLPTLGEHSMAAANNGMIHPEKPSGTGNYVPKFTASATGFRGYVFGNQNSVNLSGGGSRQGSDIILTNVIGFDVKAWDPGAPVFRAPSTSDNPNNAGVLVPGDGGWANALNRFNGGPTTADRQPVAFGAFADLNYMGVDQADAAVRYRAYQATGTSTLSALQRMESGAPFSSRCFVPRAQFGHPGDGYLSAMPTHGFARPAVWDTWSTHYEHDGIDNNGDGKIDEFTNGADDNGNGLVDEPELNTVGGVMVGEQEAPAPYRSPLRGIKITLRVMEQDSKEVREVTIVHEFMPL